MKGCICNDSRPLLPASPGESLARAIKTEESAHPFHDWNQRIVFECYRPNAYARVVDGSKRILDIHNNYSSISFNFGPTLLSWLEKKSPLIYQKVIEADRNGLKRFGYGNAMAQVYNHIIMPLANEKDKETEVVWGIADFEKRFHRRPEAMWLPNPCVRATRSNTSNTRLPVIEGPTSTAGLTRLK